MNNGRWYKPKAECGGLCVESPVYPLAMTGFVFEKNRFLIRLLCLD